MQRIVVPKLTQKDHILESIFSRFTCPKIAVPFTSSFRAILFFADLRRNKGFLLAENPFFCLSQQKK